MPFDSQFRLSLLLWSLVVAAGLTGVACGPLSESVEPSVCLSEEQWVGGEAGRPEMKPGLACMDCHSENKGPDYSFAGTVYSALEESDDCFGEGGVTIVITDANGREISVTSNAAGNFFSEEAIATPYTAKVVESGMERAMLSEQTDGDCNSCHSKEGSSSALGRIIY